MSRYHDMVHLERPASNHPRMRRQDRAKLFAPFAALSGHGDAIRARDQVLVPKTVLAEDSQAALDVVLRSLQKGDQVTVAYFVPRKTEGEEVLGEYVTVRDEVMGVDEIGRRLRLMNRAVFLDNIVLLTRLAAES